MTLIKLMLQMLIASLNHQFYSLPMSHSPVLLGGKYVDVMLRRSGIKFGSFCNDLAGSWVLARYQSGSYIKIYIVYVYGHENYGPSLVSGNAIIVRDKNWSFAVNTKAKEEEPIQHLDAPGAQPAPFQPQPR